MPRGVVAADAPDYATPVTSLPPTALPPLADWENFYVIMGSAAAGLTGLMFIVIALSAGVRRSGEVGVLHVFATPTVVHFCAVLLVAGVMTRPGHTVGSLATCVLGCGVAGVGYVGWLAMQARRQRSYEPELSDWIWYQALPFVAYASLLAAGRLLWRRPALALDVVAASTLLLLYVGIHNAWDSAVWMTAKRTQP